MKIKFRVWDKRNNRMIKPKKFATVIPVLDFNGNLGVMDTYKNWHWHGIVPEDEYELILFTGLKDKNGVEIYEGDIVELTNTYKGMNTKSIVEIDFIDFTFAGKWAEEYSPSGYMYNPLGSYNFPIVTIEVIGNIYENPELLKE